MPLIVPIADPADPRIAPYTALRERDLIGRDGHFIAEGAVVLKVLLGASRHEPVSLLVDERRLPALASLLAGLPDAVPVHVASAALLEGIIGFHLHRGILALGRRAEAPAPAALLAAAGPGARVVVLVGVANHDNVGGIFRNAAAFGAAAVLIDGATCDPLYRKAIRVSVGATLIVPFARLGAGEDPVALLTDHGFEPIALSPAGATPLARLARPDRAALIFGTEGPGLPESLLARVRTVRIPMTAGFDSLNVATASGIVLHHLACGGRAKGVRVN